MKFPVNKKLLDSHNREINYLRISVTDRCTLRCSYCNPTGKSNTTDRNDVLRFEEIHKIIRLVTARGLKKIRITGGEPLMRKGITRFVRDVIKNGGIEDVALTTNGVFLTQYAEDLYSSGLRRINISMDTLNPDKYKAITGADLFSTVWEGIKKAEEIGFYPIKLNVVLQKGFNDDEIEDIVKLTIKEPFHVRFIEYMPVKHCGMDWENKYMSSADVRKKIEKSIAKLVPLITPYHSGPAKNFMLYGAKGVVGFINAISHNFCDSCNRIRLTADGKVKHCLFSQESIDFRRPLREGGSDDYLNELIDKVMITKPKSHNLSAGSKDKKYIGSMIGVGG